MAKKLKGHTRRKRRASRARLRHDGAAPTHRSRSGRTGSIDHKRERPKADRHEIVVSLPASKPASVALREVRRATTPAPTPDVSKAGDC